MTRTDLLALTPDDLAALTNRGTLKRAAREVEAREVTAQLALDDAGTLTAQWSDQVTCTLPGGKTVHDATCSCVATVLCRHVVRTVLAYQLENLAQRAAETGAALTAPAVPEPWDPGTITDRQLDAAFKKSVLTSARTRFETGLLVEVVRSAKPSARFHQMACTLRFIVPGDVRYTHCDCAETPPCSHVPLAVWAFRMLDPAKTAGMVATQQIAFPVPADLLDTGEALLIELTIDGLSAVSPNWKDRTLRLAQRCEDAQLIWPAQVLHDLVEELDRYTGHDARFSPDHVATLAGEWLIRSDAIRSQTTAAPQLLIRGSKSDRTMEISGGRFIGLGCDVHQDRAAVDLTAYLQDADSGTIVGVGRTFTNPPKESPDPPRDFARLAQTPVAAHATLAALGAGQMITQGGKRAADHRLTLGRARATVTPQSFAWESLRAPVLAEDFQELRARLGGLPPASLRPRLIAEHLHVCPIARVIQARFNEMLQTVEVLVADARREEALIVHPYSDRCRHGCEALLSALGNPTFQLKFVSGHVRLGGGGSLLIAPVMLIFDTPTGRIAIQPWVDRAPDPATGSLPPARPFELRASGPRDFPADLQKCAAELLLLGLGHADLSIARAWQDLADRGAAFGFSRLIQPVGEIAAALTQKSSTVRWTAQPAAGALLQLLTHLKLAADLG